MKRAIKPKLLTFLVLAAGALGLVLRVVLYTTCVDEKGLLLRGHWGTTALWLLTLVTLGGLFFLTWGMEGPKKYRDCFPRSPFAALGCLAAGAATSITALVEFFDPLADMPLAASILTLAAGLCLLAAGFCRFTGRKPHFLLHVAVCLAFCLRMICLYRDWSADPQLLDYCFYMGAYVALMLTAYELAAFSCGMGSHRKLWLCSLSGLYLCLVSAWNSPAPLLLLSAALWCAGSLSSLRQPRRTHPRIQADGENP